MEETKNTGQEYTSPSEVAEMSTEFEKTLILHNDDVNTFDHVINSLVEICGFSTHEAETCALITHYKGRCPIKSGNYEELKPYYDALLDRQLTVSIE